MTRILVGAARSVVLLVFVVLPLLRSTATMKAALHNARVMSSSLSATSSLALLANTTTMMLASALSFNPNPDQSLKAADPSRSTAPPISLPELAGSAHAATTPCPPGATPILDTIRHRNEQALHRKIPQIIHITSKSRCATPKVQAIVNQWRFANYSLYFHDDEAVDRLFRHSQTRRTFPLLNETLMCVTNGATKADLWRYLVLFQYGGVYTDVDNSPVGINGDSIKPDDDSFFVIESLGIVSQFFLASSPGHPMMEFAINNGVGNIRNTVNVMRNNPARNTGPGALKNAFIQLMNGTSDGYIDAGLYRGLSSPRNVTVVGDKSNAHEYVNRQGLNSRDKAAYYKALGIEHFHDNSRFPIPGRIGCMEHIQRMRNNGTYKIANYRFDEVSGQYVEA